MKNNIKKIIIGFFAFVFLFAGHNAFAYVAWNNGTQGPDCSTMNIANNTTGVGGPSGLCWTGVNINASPGDYISVKVYYHNTGNETADNTRIKVYAPSGAATNHSFTGEIRSDQSSLAGGPVSVTIPTPQGLTFVSTTWYTRTGPNNNLIATTLLGGQNGQEVLGSNGLDIGDIISNNVLSQGAVVVKFKVNSTPPPQNCSIDSFTANPSTITNGGSSVLSWNTTGCTSVKLNNNSVSFDGSQTVSPTTTTTYTLKAYNSAGALMDTESKTVIVNNTVSNCSINSFTASPLTINQGQYSILNWQTSNCTNVAISPLSYNVPSSGSQQVYPNQTTTYTLTATGSNGVIKTKSVTVTVNGGASTVCKINSFEANPSTIVMGGTSVLSWQTSNCTAVMITPYIGTLAVNGSKTVTPSVTTTYTLKAVATNGTSQTRTTTVIVNTVTPQNCSIDSFTANPSTIINGNSSNLAWKTTNCTSVKLYSGSTLINIYGPNGTKSVSPTTTTVYTLKSYGVNGAFSDTRTTTVIVGNSVSYSCSINSFTASPNSIHIGDTSTLSWDTSNCLTVGLNGAEVSTSGNDSVSPLVTTTYTLRAIGSNGIVRTRSITVYVNTIIVSNCQINSFTSSPTSINIGDSSTLTWSTSNCGRVTIDGAIVANSGNKTVWPTNTKTYVLEAFEQAYGGTNPKTAQTTVYVDEESNTCEIVNFEASDTSIDEGDYSRLTWNTNNCQQVKITELGFVDEDGSDKVYPTSDKTYTLTAFDSNGSTKTDTVRIYVDDNNNNNDDCSIDSFTASDTYISRDDEVTLRWRTTDCDDVSISHIGDVSDDGSETVSPYSTTTYLLKAYGDNGNDSESIKIYVDYNYGSDLSNTNVVTTVATNISQNSASINGLLTSSNYSNDNVSTYFEYGTTVNLGLRTPNRSTNGNSNISEYITNLSPNTIYFFRARAEGVDGVSVGAIEVFRTLGYTNTNYSNNTNSRTVREVVYQQGTTVTGSMSPLVLQIENKYQTIGVGDMVDYVVFYKNISTSVLEHPMVQVFIPQGLTITNTSSGTYSESNRTLSVPIDDLQPDEEGVVYLQARVDSLDTNLAQIVTTAILVYTNPNGAQENAMAYVLNNPRLLNNNSLGASAFFSGIFGMSLIGWLFLIIVIMLLILLSRSYYNRHNTTTTVTHL